MRAWIARDKNRTALFNNRPEWDRLGFWGGWTIKSFDYDLFRIEFPEIELDMNHRQQIELTARPIGEAEGGGDV